jgi:2-methylcitrate synthase
MEVVRTIISYMGVIESEKSFDEQLDVTKRLLGVTTTAIVYWYKYSHEGVRVEQISNEVSVAAHFLKLLRQEEISDLHKKTLDVSLTLYAEHEFNASTFTGRVCASTLSDLHSCLTAAVGSLRGPLHGGANEEAMKMLEEIDSLENVKEFIDHKLEKKDKVMGFGHAVYSVKDPRSDIIKEYSAKLSENHKDKILHDAAVIMEAYLKEKKGLFPNTDFFHAPAYHYLGIPTKLFTPLFAIARIIGWSAHAYEQRDNNRIIRPSADYIGPEDRNWVDIESR